MAAVFEIPANRAEEFKKAHAISVEDRSYRIHRNGFVFVEERHIPHLTAHGLIHRENNVAFPTGYEPVTPGDAEGQKRLLDDAPAGVETEASWRERFAEPEALREEPDKPGPSAGAGRRKAKDDA